MMIPKSLMVFVLWIAVFWIITLRSGVVSLEMVGRKCISSDLFGA